MYQQFLRPVFSKENCLWQPVSRGNLVSKLNCCLRHRENFSCFTGPKINSFTTFSNFKHRYIKKFYWSSHIFHWSSHFFISRGPRTDKFRGVCQCLAPLLSNRISVIHGWRINYETICCPQFCTYSYQILCHVGGTSPPTWHKIW